MMSDISLRVQGKAGRITLKRPKALNAMTYEMCLAIEKILIEWKYEPKVEIIIIDAEGERALPAIITSLNLKTCLAIFNSLLLF